ncbi:MAG: Crp/Fnr family transcriptional regulator [Bacteroidota bacterium]
MDTYLLMHILGSISPLSSKLQERFSDYLVEEEFPKKHILLHEGETCRRIWFIKSGVTRAYYLNEQGDECTSWFMNTGNLMISVYSFLRQLPAYEHIEILEPSTLQSISYQQLQSIYADFEEGNLIGRIMTERYYLLAEERAIMLRTRSVEERYLHLLETHPDIMEKASQKQVASYLACSQETLCRLRAKLPMLTKVNKTSKIPHLI